jgi:hypothetical protein
MGSTAQAGSAGAASWQPEWRLPLSYVCPGRMLPGFGQVSLGWTTTGSGPQPGSGQQAPIAVSAPRDLPSLRCVSRAGIRFGGVLAIFGSSVSGSFWPPTSGPDNQLLAHLILGRPLAGPRA